MSQVAAVATNPVIAIQRSTATVAMFGELSTTLKTASSKLEALAVDLAQQVKTLSLPTTSKIALVEATYSKEYADLAADRNAVQVLRALVWAKCAADTMVEIAPPSKDGKVAAVFKKAVDLTPKQAKENCAALKAIVKEAEETPEQAKVREAAAAKAKLDAQVAANNAATAAAAAKSVEAFAYVLSDSQRPHLIQELAKIGYALTKIKTAPAK